MFCRTAVSVLCKSAQYYYITITVDFFEAILIFWLADTKTNHMYAKQCNIYEPTCRNEWGQHLHINHVLCHVMNCLSRDNPMIATFALWCGGIGATSNCFPKCLSWCNGCLLGHRTRVEEKNGCNSGIVFSAYFILNTHFLFRGCL